MDIYMVYISILHHLHFDLLTYFSRYMHGLG